MIKINRQEKDILLEALHLLADTAEMQDGSFHGMSTASISLLLEKVEARPVTEEEER